MTKTIRLHWAIIKSWIGNMTDVKVIQLIRDPRAIYQSQRPYADFQYSTNHFSTLCQNMAADGQLADILPSNRYLIN